MKDVCAHDECTGCSACGSICGQSAITFKQDTLGFLYPIINGDKCVECGLCEKICPSNHRVMMMPPIASYVGYAVDEDEQLSSSSGGVASVVARHFLKKGGIVYGCYAENINEIGHIRVDNENELKKLKGSKYVQSNMRDIFLRVRNDLKSGKDTLFIGTPCQVAGLKSYLRKNYDNLLTIDFVCHGVPSQKILKESLKPQLQEMAAEQYNLSFRRKVKRGNEYSTEYGIYIYSPDKGYLYRESYPKDMYITGFLAALFYRKSCYVCPYATQKRVSDITVGDYSDGKGDYNYMDGRKRLLSMITVNTLNGDAVLNELQDVLSVAHVDYSKLIAAQGQLRQPMRIHNGRDEFERYFAQTDFNSLVRRILNSDLKRIRKIMLAAKIRDILFSLPFIKLVNNKRA